MRKTLKGTLAILAAIAGITLIAVAILVYSFGIPRQHVTTDIADYGQYIGNYDNHSVQDFITSFFPQEIESTFSDITYSYRAQKNDAYAFEAYLAFNIEDVDQFNAYIRKNIDGLEKRNFYYDSAYTEYVLSDELVLNTPRENLSAVGIRYAKIGKILCNTNTQEIIFVALGVYDGGIAKTDFLTVYFDRFNINPLEYKPSVGFA